MAEQRQEDPAFLAAFHSWRRSLSDMTGLGLSQEERQQRAAAARRDDVERQCRRCEKMRDQVIAESPIVRFMLQHIDSLPRPDYAAPPAPSASDDAGGPSTSASSSSSITARTAANSPVPIYCMPCEEGRGGGFAPNIGVVLCQDRLYNRKHAEDTLAHELIHEWDHRRFNVDWNDLRMLACSEIRAASLSGDCRWGREMKRHNYAFTKQHQACTKRRAILSVLQHPKMLASPSDTPDRRQQRSQEAERLVNEVWQSCWNDTRPFDEIY